MEFARELLELATGIARLHPENIHQASLRRAVSTAYYAIFHLLISEATSNWARPELRNQLGRCFDHGSMRSASESMLSEMNTLLKKSPLFTLPLSSRFSELVIHLAQLDASRTWPVRDAAHCCSPSAISWSRRLSMS